MRPDILRMLDCATGNIKPRPVQVWYRDDVVNVVNNFLKVALKAFQVAKILLQMKFKRLKIMYVCIKRLITQLYT